MPPRRAWPSFDTATSERADSGGRSSASGFDMSNEQDEQSGVSEMGREGRPDCRCLQLMNGTPAVSRASHQRLVAARRPPLQLDLDLTLISLSSSAEFFRALFRSPHRSCRTPGHREVARAGRHRRSRVGAAAARAGWLALRHLPVAAGRRERHSGGEPEHRERVDRPVLDWPRGLHGGGRVPVSERVAGPQRRPAGVRARGRVRPGVLRALAVGWRRWRGELWLSRWPAVAAPEGRLPGHRHPGLRRNHSGHRAQRA
jgi:hypothetical protein